MTFGERLIQAREAAGMTRAQLAAAIGGSEESVCAWEGGARCPGFWYAPRLEHALPALGDVPRPDRKRKRLGPRKEITTVYLDAGQLDSLRMVAEQKMVAVASLIRDAIDLYLDSTGGER